MAQPRICDELVAHEKSDASEELGHVHSSDSSPLCSEFDPPDGGFRAWGTAFGGFLMQFCGFGYISSFGLYQDYYTRIYMANYPPSTISWIGAITSFLAVNVTLISGPLYDRGWFYRLMIVGSLLQSISLFALSFAKPGQFYLAFIVQGVLAGFGMGLTYTPSIAVVSQHFSKRRTMVMSVVTSGTPLGSMIHSIILNHLLNGTVGFARGVRASAGFVSVSLMIACLSMRTRGLVAPTVSYTTVVRKCSHKVLFILMTIGYAVNTVSDRVLIPSVLPATGLCQACYWNGHGLLGNQGQTSMAGGYGSVYRGQTTAHARNYRLRARTPATAPGPLPLPSCPARVPRSSINIDFSFYTLVILNAACFIGRCTAGIAATYMGVLNLAIASTVACSAVIISIIALNDVASVVVLGLAYGYLSCVYIAMIVPLATVFTPDPSELGARMGISFAFIAFSGLLSGPISGALLGSQYMWWKPSLFNGIISLVGSLMLVAMRLIIYRRGTNGNHA